MPFPQSINLRGTTSDKRSRRLFSVGLFLLAALIYANSFPGTFVLDDIHIAQNNPLVKSPDLVKILRSDYWYPNEHSGLYRPLTILSLAVNRLLLGSEAWAFHLVNVLLHAAVTVLFWRLLLVWGLPLLAALLAAALFAVHPVHQEAVNVIVGRSELFVALFLLCAFLNARGGSRAAPAVTGVCFLGALLAKENAITFLAMLPIADAFLAGSPRIWKERWRLYSSLLAIAALWLAWYKFGVVSDLPKSRVTEAAAPLAHVDGVTRILTALEHQWLYLKLLLVPVPLQSVYSVADLPAFIDSLVSPMALLVLGATAVLLVTLFFGWRRRELAALFGVLYIAAFSVTSNIPFAIGVTMAERLAYLPSLWFCAALAVVLLRDWNIRVWRRIGLVLGCAWLVFYAAVCLQRNPDFLSEPELWMAEVRQNPNDFLGWQNVGETLTNNNRYVEAEAAYQRMMALAPDYPGGLRSWTFFLITRGRFAEALASASRSSSLSAEKGDRIAVAFDSLDIAESLIALGRNEEALSSLEAAMPLLDRVSRYHELRARALSALERDSEAMAEFAKVTTIAPGSNLHMKLAVSLLRLGRQAEALEQLRKDLQVRGGYAETWNLMGVAEAQQGNWPEAIDAFGQASSLEPGNRYYRDNLQRARTEQRK